MPGILFSSLTRCLEEKDPLMYDELGTTTRRDDNDGLVRRSIYLAASFHCSFASSSTVKGFSKELESLWCSLPKPLL